MDFYGIHSKTETYTYTAFGELKTAEGDNFFAEYCYGADGFRSGKKVNGVSTGYVYDGMYIVGESVDGVNYTYSRGTDLLGYTSSLGETVYYRTNVHGDVKELVNVFGESLERYDYNAYGAEDEDYNPFRRMFGKKSVYNPFRYTGEYTDSETGFIYLRNRYYDPSIGRFTTEDPAKDGLNWYVYCECNPVNRWDPWGLAKVAIRDYANEYGGTVNWSDRRGLAFFEINGNIFRVTGSGDNNEGITVTNVDGRLYAEDSDLNNFFFGVTPEDTEAGVRITMLDGTPYIDISIPVENALKRDVGDFESKRGNNTYFASRVGNKGDWNLKYREADENHWEETLGISFWGYQTQMLLNGNLVIVEQVGNITYGYLGTAAGMSESWMNIGSAFNHFFKHGFFGWDNERADQSLFKLGINWYNTGIMK